MSIIDIKIKSVQWKNIETTGTKKEFDSGKKEFVFSPIIKCELPDNFPVFEPNQHPFVFSIKNRKPITYYMSGYHIGNLEIFFSTHQVFEREFEIQNIYSL